MSTYQNILVGIEVQGPEGNKPFRQACAYARDHDATLHIATVLDVSGTWERMDPKLKQMKREAQEILEKYQKQAEESGVSDVKMILDIGSAKARITRHLVPQHNIDLIIVGAATGNKMDKLILGSVAEGIVRQANCDVLTVKETADSK